MILFGLGALRGWVWLLIWCGGDLWGLGCYVRLVFWFPCLVDWVSDFGGAFMFPWVCQ